jgi:fermentation-respiration switch protein FrsA (DUF1100 family)
MWLMSSLSSYRFPTAAWMQSVRAPALVIHGDADTVIAYRHGRQLHEGLSGPKTFFTVRGGDHNDAAPRDGAGYWAAIEALVTAARARSAGGRPAPPSP